MSGVTITTRCDHDDSPGRDDTRVVLCLKDRSLIMGRGAKKKGKIVGRKLFAPPPPPPPPPPKDRVKLFAPTLLQGANFLHPPSSPCVKTSPKLVAPPPPPFSMAKTFSDPLFIGVKLYMPPPPPVL